MATSTIKLYYGTTAKPWKLTSGKAFIIEDIEAYLNTCEALIIYDFQYIKNDMSIDIKVDLQQYYAQPLYANGIEYVSVTNSDINKTYYYYVNKAEWRSTSAVRLMLSMDVINTFKIGVDYTLNKRTKINRQHAPRFKKVQEANITAFAETYTSGFVLGDIVEIDQDGHTIKAILEDLEIQEDNYITGLRLTLVEGVLNEYLPFDMWGTQGGYLETEEQPRITLTNTYYRNVHILGENITPTLYKKDIALIEREGVLNHNWYLIYRNQNTPSEALVNPVECYLMADSDLNINVGAIQEGGRIDANNIEEGKQYYIIAQNSINNAITLDDGVTYNLTHVTSNYYYVMLIKKGDIILFTYINLQGTTLRVVEQKLINSVSLNVLPLTYYKYNNDNIIHNVDVVISTTPYTWTQEGTQLLTIDNINKLDRTDAKTFKVIKLPYVPYDFSVENDTIILQGSAWEHVLLSQTSGGVISVLKLKDLSTKFNYYFRDNNVNPLSVLKDAPHFADMRDDFNESKLYNSEFYAPKFVYDSFSFTFNCELIDTSSVRDNMLFNYVVTSTINSRFMFIFSDYKTLNKDLQDYNNVLSIARNNEITLYNVPYINYIRNGYNYDVKSKYRSDLQTSIGAGLSVGTTILGALLTATGVGAGVGVPLTIGGVVGTASSISNAIFQQQQSEINLNAKLDNARMQSTSVSGADDVDLMSAYTSNRAKWVLYKASDTMTKLLADLFYYTGYIANVYGVPQTHTRKYFNYVQANIIIDEANNLSSEAESALINMYNNGVTFVHNVNNYWDVDQVKENIEEGLL